MAVNVISRVISVAVLASLLASCETQRKANLDSTTSADAGADAVVEESPVMVEQVIELPSGAKVGAVQGKCLASRPGKVGKALRRGQSLRDGDGLELGQDCVLSISISDQRRELHLTRENGRFFRVRAQH